MTPLHAPSLTDPDEHLRGRVDVVHMLTRFEETTAKTKAKPQASTQGYVAWPGEDDVDDVVDAVDGDVMMVMSMAVLLMTTVTVMVTLLVNANDASSHQAVCGLGQLTPLNSTVHSLYTCCPTVSQKQRKTPEKT